MGSRLEPPEILPEGIWLTIFPSVGNPMRGEGESIRGRREVRCRLRMHEGERCEAAADAILGECCFVFCLAGGAGGRRRRDWAGGVYRGFLDVATGAARGTRVVPAVAEWCGGKCAFVFLLGGDVGEQAAAVCAVGSGRRGGSGLGKFVSGSMERFGNRLLAVAECQHGDLLVWRQRRN